MTLAILAWWGPEALMNQTTAAGNMPMKKKNASIDDVTLLPESMNLKDLKLLNWFCFYALEKSQQ